MWWIESWSAVCEKKKITTRLSPPHFSSRCELQFFYGVAFFLRSITYCNLHAYLGNCWLSGCRRGRPRAEHGAAGSRRVHHRPVHRCLNWAGICEKTRQMKGNNVKNEEENFDFNKVTIHTQMSCTWLDSLYLYFEPGYSQFNFFSWN